MSTATPGSAAKAAETARAKQARPVPKVTKPGTGETARTAPNEAIRNKARAARSTDEMADTLAKLFE
jgi:hypothetical protein